MDLADLTALSSANEGYRFLLVLIDAFSKYLCVQPLKSKQGPEVAKALREILENALPPPFPAKISSDRGKEFINASVMQLLGEKGIKYFNPGAGKSNFVERVNRTLKGRIFRYMTQVRSRRYIDKLQDFVRSYNTSYHSAIQMTPTEADLPANESRIRRALGVYYSKREMGSSTKGSRNRKQRKIKPKFKVGDPVRITKFRHAFSRGFHAIFKNETFRILSIDRRHPRVMYTLTNYDSSEEPIQAQFYENELTRQNIPLVHNTIKRILPQTRVNKKRGGVQQHLVEWKDPKKRNSWLDKDALENLPLLPGEE